MTVEEWINSVIHRNEGDPFGWAAEKWAIIETIYNLSNPNCPGSADVLAEIQRRREAATKPLTRAEQVEEAMNRR